MKNIHSVMRWFLLTACLLLLSNSAFAQARTISGTVIDDKGETVPFAAVFVTGTTSGVQTDMQGKFSFTVPASAKSITVRFIGYKEKIIDLNSKINNYDIRIESELTALSEVVVVGNMARKKESFTGSYTTVSGNELRQMGSQNIVQSLRSMDASFVVLENLAAGADPNAMPDVELRGRTSMDFSDVEDRFAYDPNAPLFVLDGFETTLEKIIDLDPNRVASVTILKDAASTAFYGSRAANGVLLVETVKGEPGRFKVTYSGTYSTEIPILSSYNMMNAYEKLEFERLAGYYKSQGGYGDYRQVVHQARLDTLYYGRLGEVLSGVESYWMSDPLRIPLQHRQTIRISGGEKNLVVGAGLDYRSTPGIMKGSGRNSWGADLDLDYSQGMFTLVSRTDVSGVKGTGSPYGSFQDWVNASPYYRKSDELGEYSMFLDIVKDNAMSLTGDDVRIINPLYIAQLPSKNEDRTTNLSENLRLSVDFKNNMRIEGILQLSYAHAVTENFVSPSHPMYLDAEETKKGNYSNNTADMFSYTGQLVYTWANTFGKHSFSANAKAEMRDHTTSNWTWTATGFPVGTPPTPSFSNNYPVGSPSYRRNISRSTNFVATGGYVYDNRYLFDATFIGAGSSVFGSAKKYSPYYAVGAGWNLHEEDFLKPLRMINKLVLRATYGVTANQNIGSTNSTSLYLYQAGGNWFGPGVTVASLGNPFVEWQQTYQPNLALEVSLFDNRLTTKFEIWQKRSTPQAVQVPQILSSGSRTFPMSLGSLTYRGFEYDLGYQILRLNNLNWRIQIKGSVLSDKYDGFDDKLAQMDELARQNQQLQRYRDGYSTNTMWAVKSLGIDPSTGREIYLDKTGKPVMVWDVKDEVDCGNSYPITNGTIAMFFTLKQFTISVAASYGFQQERFNKALFEKVENISYEKVGYNQDRRALYDRWQQPGDHTQFKNIALASSREPARMSSRFIQTENYLFVNNMTVTWRVPRTAWMEQVGVTRVDIRGEVGGSQGVFRLSNLLQERGTSYPESTRLALTIDVGF